MAHYTITIAGDSALNLSFAESISPETSTAIRMAADNLSDDPIHGVTELVPTFCSLMVCYNPLIISYDELVKALSTKLHDIGSIDLSVRHIVHIPVCYGGEYGPDLQTVADHAHMSAQEAIAIHSQHDYLIDMLGFLPGFAYLGGLDERLATPRLATPRTRIETGSVGIGGTQTGIYPLPSPGGWQIIGRTPLRPYDPNRKNPILYQAGEYIRFEPISPDEYSAIETQIAANSYQYHFSVEED
ncbi:MAG: 5-oxoprolinase subunit PxpB [Eggerthellaceae bacterium]|jgi:KipI family sensor histidine kinase inhibitor|nr:5-oxoprolinase subunit PxpB [Eggerthellaceae bacterium]MCH4220976.1 5-oxoprolinase subunit PxpB [Eggerthellaceae bacterium]